MLAFGFSSGLPFALLIGTLNAWLGEVGVNLATIGVLSWIGLALTMLVAVQRATAPKLLYWQWRPLNPGASPYGPFVNRNGLACWLAMAIPLIIGYAVARRQSHAPGASFARLADGFAGRAHGDDEPR